MDDIKNDPDIDVLDCDEVSAHFSHLPPHFLISSKYIKIVTGIESKELQKMANIKEVETTTTILVFLSLSAKERKARKMRKNHLCFKFSAVEEKNKFLLLLSGLLGCGEIVNNASLLDDVEDEERLSGGELGEEYQDSPERGNQQQSSQNTQRDEKLDVTSPSSLATFQSKIQSTTGFFHSFDELISFALHSTNHIVDMSIQSPEEVCKRLNDMNSVISASLFLYSSLLTMGEKWNYSYQKWLFTCLKTSIESLLEDDGNEAYISCFSTVMNCLKLDGLIPTISSRSSDLMMQSMSEVTSSDFYHQFTSSLSLSLFKTLPPQYSANPNSSFSPNSNNSNNNNSSQQHDESNIIPPSFFTQLFDHIDENEFFQIVSEARPLLWRLFLIIQNEVIKETELPIYTILNN